MKIIDFFKGIVFDLDGVLVDTEGLHYLSWVEILKEFGIAFSENDYFSYAGKREDIIDGELINQYKIDVKKGDLFHKKKELMEGWVKSKNLRLMPYSKESVKYFISQKKMLAVCTGSQKTEAMVKLKRTSFSSLFPIVITGSDVKRGKPFPDVYLLAAKKLKLKPQECITFEDTQYGVESAKSAGLCCIAVPNKFSVKQDFSKADKTFKNLREAINYLKREH